MMLKWNRTVWFQFSTEILASNVIRGAVKKFPEFFISKLRCSMISYGLGRVLWAISTCKFCRGSGRQGQWFLHHDNAPNHTSSSPSHRTLRISLRVTFGCSLLWIWAKRGHVSQPWRASDRMRRPNSGRFQKRLSAGVCNNGRIDVASVCARRSYFQGDYINVVVVPTITAQYLHSGNFLTAHHI
jgi:hypothetical protein